jgi:hypothetical protein
MWLCKINVDLDYVLIELRGYLNYKMAILGRSELCKNLTIIAGIHPLKCVIVNHRKAVHPRVNIPRKELEMV